MFCASQGDFVRHGSDDRAKNNREQTRFSGGPGRRGPVSPVGVADAIDTGIPFDEQGS